MTAGAGRVDHLFDAREAEDLQHRLRVGLVRADMTPDEGGGLGYVAEPVVSRRIHQPRSST